MKHVNNNMNISNVHVQPKTDLSKKTKPEISTFEITDFKNPTAEALGRSQVPTNIDNLENNILFMMKHPDQVKQSNAFFDNMYETLKSQNVEDAYEKSTQYAGAFKSEFLSK